MNLMEAGFDILYYLMTLDKKIENKEIQEIVQYLAHTERDNKKSGYFSNQTDFTSLTLEIGLVSSLNEDELEKRYEKALFFYQENSSKAQKKELIRFAGRLVKADGTVIEEEKNALKRLTEIFEKNISKKP